MADEQQDDTAADEQLYALVDESGTVVNIIVADDEFVAGLADAIDDEFVDTGDLPRGLRAYHVNDVVDTDGSPITTDHRRAGNGRWVIRDEVVQAREEARQRQQDEADAAAARQEQDTRIAELRKKVGKGKPGLTQDERDELNLIMLERDVASA